MRITRQRFTIRSVTSTLAFVTFLGGGAVIGSSGVAGASGGTISYGVLSCFTGPLASLGQGIDQGAVIGAAAVNAAGGVLGKRLLVPTGDTGCDPVEGKTALLKLISGGGIAGIIGPTTQEINAVEPVMKANHIWRHRPRYFWGVSPTLRKAYEVGFDRNGFTLLPVAGIPTVDEVPGSENVF